MSFFDPRRILEDDCGSAGGLAFRVIVGIALSTLHQSSLGSLLLIMPVRVHELWYSPILPVIFFITAAALGLISEPLLIGVGPKKMQNACPGGQ